MWQGWVNIFLGVWLAVAPGIPMDAPWNKLNNIYLGVLAAFVSGSIPIKKPWASWLGMAAGIWVASSTYFNIYVTGLGYLWSNTISGVLIFIAGSLTLVNFPQERNA